MTQAILMADRERSGGTPLWATSPGSLAGPANLTVQVSAGEEVAIHVGRPGRWGRSDSDRRLRECSARLEQGATRFHFRLGEEAEIDAAFLASICGLVQSLRVRGLPAPHLVSPQEGPMALLLEHAGLRSAHPSPAGART